MTWEMMMNRFALVLPATVLLNATLIASSVPPIRAQQIRSSTPDQSVSADLAFNFQCKGEASQEFDETIERFLGESYFDVLNRPRLRRERNMTPLPTEVMIDGLDDSRRMIRIASSGLRVGTYFLQFFTPPPMSHAETFEKQLLALVSDTLGCRVYDVVRNDNSPKKRAFYEEVFRAKQKSFQETK
jgi:hypothetical protein